MSWTSPRTWVAGELVTAAIMNTHVRDNLSDLDARLTSFGAWTPALQFGGGTTGLAYTTQSGRYVKVGRLVMLQGHILLSNKGSSTGQAAIRALPFTVENVSSGFSGTAHIAFWNTLNTGVTFLTGLVVNNTTRADLYQATGGASSSANVDDTYFANTTALHFSMVYVAST